MTSNQLMTRREFNRASAAASATAVASVCLPGCSGGGPDYETLVANIWRHSDTSAYQGSAVLRELVRYGTLAANSHNTQPWRFQLDHQRITVRPDYDRRCSAVDPDDHHVFASLGCAVENIVVAAKAHGLQTTVSMDAVAGEDAIHIDLDTAAAVDSPRFQAITERQCTRAQYDRKQVPGAELTTLEQAAQTGGVNVRIFTARKDLEQILEYVVAGNSAQMNDEAFISELKDWLRFNESAAIAHRDGLFSATSGNPTSPTWIGNIAFDWFFKEGSENDKYRDHIRSSAGAIAFIADQNNKQGWVSAGRSYQRFALQSTALGLRHAFINQAVEVPQVRAQFADYLGIGSQRPNLLVRFGYGPKLPQSLRRPIGDVLM